MRSLSTMRLVLLGACLLSPLGFCGGGGLGFTLAQDDEKDNMFGDPSPGPTAENSAVAPAGNDFIETEPVGDGKVRMVITFEDILPDEIESLLAVAGISVDEVNIVLTIPEQLAEVVMMTFEWARIIAKLPFVKYVEEDPKLYLIPADIEYVEGLSKATGGSNGATRKGMRGLQSSNGRPNLDYDDMYGLDMVRAYDVSDEFIDGRKICIIDSGCDQWHEDLKANSISGTEVGNVGAWYRDDNGHGTHVAGTIAAVNGNNMGLQGVIRNGKANLYCVKIFGASGESYASEAVYELQKCKNAGAHVVSMSYGRTDSLWTGPTNFEREAYDRAYNDDGMLLIAAAGNDGNSKNTWPASYEAVMSVGSVGKNKGRSDFSQYNDAVEIAAPGDRIASTYPDNEYVYLSGTSMSAPHVSGVAALVWSHFTDKSAQEIRQALVESAEDLGANGRDRFTGYGLCRADLAYQYLANQEGGGSAGGGGTPGGGTGGGAPGGGTGGTGGNTGGGSGGGGGGGGQQMCVTDPSFWKDSSGTGCEWYDNGFLCQTFGRFYESYGKTARTACCSCGGGKMVTADVAPANPPQQVGDQGGDQDNQGNNQGGQGNNGQGNNQGNNKPAPGQCVDETGWTDSFGDGCDWYRSSSVDRCAEYGTCCPGKKGMTAADACCVCRGKMMSAFALHNDKSGIAGDLGDEVPVKDDAEEVTTTTSTTTTESPPVASTTRNPTTSAPTGKPSSVPAGEIEAASGASSHGAATLAFGVSVVLLFSSLLAFLAGV